MAKLYFYYAAMNAGKTTMLLQAAYNYKERGMETLLFTAAIDDRYGQRKVQSRLGINSVAIPFDSQLDLFKFTQIQKQQLPLLNCVLVDEGQFLTQNQVKQLTTIVDSLNIPVLVYGLRSDFRGQPFEGSKYLLIWADNISEIKTICHCGKKATMNLRIDTHGQIVTAGEQVKIGGNNDYISVCRKHFKEGNPDF